MPLSEIEQSVVKELIKAAINKAGGDGKAYQANLTAAKEAAGSEVYMPDLVLKLRKEEHKSEINALTVSIKEELNPPPEEPEFP